MKVIKKVIFFLLSLVSLFIFFYLLGFLFVLFEKLSNLWIILITFLGGGIIGIITFAYISILDKLIPKNKIANAIFILIAIVIGIMNITVHWQIDISLIPRLSYIFICTGSCLLIINSRFIPSNS